MLKSFQKHIQSTFPELEHQKIILACSGGIDSVVLTHLCQKLNLKFSLAHCNFKLRGEESYKDARFVQDLAKMMGVELLQKDFDTHSIQESEGGSIQMVARNLRYQWFDALLHEERFDVLLTAHHADDDLETFLINLSRGTGIEGLSGIPERRNNIVRPLLLFSREEISAFAKTERIHWREDASNDDIKYLRNAVRHQVIPNLKKLHPSFLQNFRKTQQLLKQTKAIAAEEIKRQKMLLFKGDAELYTISIVQLRKLNPLESYCYALFKQFGFKEPKEIIRLMTSDSGKELHSLSHRLLKDRTYFLLQKKELKHAEKYHIDQRSTYIDKPIALKLEEVYAVNELKKETIYVDKETLNYPLTLRKWEKGDYFYPYGMRGKKKLSKFFKDEKMNQIAKERQWLLVSGDDILWVVGKRADDRFKVTQKTKTILKIGLKE